MKGWSPGSFATGNANNNAVKQAVQGLSMVANTLEKFLTKGNGSGSSKGSGKGGKGSKGALKNAAKGTGKGQAKAPPEGSWYCRRNDCQWAFDGRYNLPFRNQCGHCNRKKCEAMNPPAHARTGPPSEPSFSTKQKKAAEAAARKKAEETAKEGAHADVTSIHKDIPVKDTEKPLDLGKVQEEVKTINKENRKAAFSMEQAESFSAAAPALTQVSTSLSRESFPTACSSSKDPQVTASSFLKDSPQFTKGLALLEAEAEVQHLQSTQLTYPSEHDFHVMATKLLVAAQAKVLKLSKESPSHGLKTCCFTEVRAAYQRAVQTRKDRTEKGKEAANTRRTERWQAVRKVRAELDAFEDALETLEEELQRAHLERHQEHEAFDEEVMASLREELEEWSEGAPMEEDTPEDWVNIDRPADPALEGQRKLKEAAEEKLRNLQVEIEKARTEAAEAKAKLEEKEKEQADRTETTVRDLNLDPAELPHVPEPTPEEIPMLDRAWHVISMAKWSPFASTVTCAVLGLDVPHLKTLLGELWPKVYQSEDPKEDEPLDPNILFLLDAALNRIGKTLAGRPQEERSKTKLEAKAALESLPKKARIA